MEICPDTKPAANFSNWRLGIEKLTYSGLICTIVVKKPDSPVGEIKLPTDWASLPAIPEIGAVTLV